MKWSGGISHRFFVGFVFSVVKRGWWGTGFREGEAETSKIHSLNFGV